MNFREIRSFATYDGIIKTKFVDQLGFAPFSEFDLGQFLYFD